MENKTSGITGYAVCGVKSTWGLSTAGSITEKFITYDSIEIWPLTLQNSNLSEALKYYIDTTAKSPLGYFFMAVVCAILAPVIIAIRSGDHTLQSIIPPITILAVIVVSFFGFISLLISGFKKISPRITMKKKFSSPNYDSPEIHLYCLEGQAKHILEKNRSTTPKYKEYKLPKPKTKNEITAPNGSTGEIIPQTYSVEIVGVFITLTQDGISQLPAIWHPLLSEKLRKLNSV